MGWLIASRCSCIGRLAHHTSCQVHTAGHTLCILLTAPAGICWACASIDHKSVHADYSCWIVQTTVPPVTDVSMTPKSAPPLSRDEGISADPKGQGPEQLQQQSQTSPDALQHSAAGQAGGDDMAASASEDLHATMAPTMTSATAGLISVKLLHLFLGKGLQAAKGWGAMTSPMPLVNQLHSFAHQGMKYWFDQPAMLRCVGCHLQLVIRTSFDSMWQSQ